MAGESKEEPQPEGHVDGPVIGEVGTFRVLPPNAGPPQWMLPFLKPAFDVVSATAPSTWSMGTSVAPCVQAGSLQIIKLALLVLPPFAGIR